MTEDAVEAPNGLIAGRYRLVRLIGRGGMGAVWEGWDETLRRPVALKLLHTQQGLPEAEAALVSQRAMREARLAARLAHRHAVSVFDIVEHEGQPCLVMEYVPSEPLSDILRELRTLDEHEAATLGAQVASALVAAHGVGIVHRDVKPGNILIADDGTARISDFGIAHAFDDTSLTATGMVSGTPAYLAPEVARGDASGYPSDVFSLGATLYAALEGSPPFGEHPNPMGLLHRVASGQIEPLQHQGALTPLLTEMLSADPQDRPSMAEVEHELRWVAEGGDAAAGEAARDGAAAGVAPTAALANLMTEQDEPRDPGPTEVAPPSVPSSASPSASPGPPTRRSPGRRLGALLAVLAAAAVIVVVFLVTRGGDPTAPTPAAPSAQTTPGAAPSAAAASAVSASPGSSATTSAPPAPTASTAPTTSTTATAPIPASAPAPSTGGSGTPSAQQLASAVGTYYGLVPGNLDAAWPLMTSSYQTRVAGGRQAYERFWATFSRVTATEVSGTPPSSATALITYVGKNSQVTRERTTFGFVTEGGVLKIDSSTVTSRS